MERSTPTKPHARRSRNPKVVCIARHALVPPRSAQFLWTDSKAALLSDAIRGLGASAVAVTEDVVDLVGRRGGSAAWWPKTWAIVNATASLNVREALAAAHERLASRVIECSLFGQGRIGLMTVEGPERNPDTGDLITAAYRLMHADPASAALVFGDGPDARRARVGESCGSWTMVMSDARLSIPAASMSEAIAALQLRHLLNDEHRPGPSRPPHRAGGPARFART